ncbi:AbrB/MazE/SpoVT family DNA-binding domain-containing protein [Halobacteriales archaeon QS_6_71_20]|nr:MAG: AbrB/MazE/SpoVT family DNA-binding domain-containing protein [Halobacteriales archaeon QS_6_71_20]
MSSNSCDPAVVRVSEKGQATIPKALREKFGIEAPGKVFVYEADGRVVLEPVLSMADLHGIHAGDREPGAVSDRVQEVREAEREHEDERAGRFRHDEDDGK